MVCRRNNRLIVKAKSIALCAIIIAAVCKKKRMQKRQWCKEWLGQRKVLGSHATILRELQDGHEKDFTNYMRMDPNTFYKLLAKVEPYIKKKDTIMRDSISAEARLEATLLFLSTGCTYTSLQYRTRISKQSLSLIIPATCQAMYEVLKEEYLQTPKSPEEWKHVADGFWSEWNFPNCLGSLDGKHIAIRPPSGSDSYYFNYKGTHSIVLVAVCDANSEFIYVDVGTKGRLSDGGVWDNTVLGRHIANDTAGLPADIMLPGSHRTLPFVFVADDAFPLQRHILKPFPHRNQTCRQRIFSYRLSRARRTVENAFGMLADRFQVLQKPINLTPEKVEKVVLACTVLHNFLRRDPMTQYARPGGSLDLEDISNGRMTPGQWRSTPELLGLQRVGRNATNVGKNVRDQYMEYFNEEGAVPWQEKMAS